MQHRNGGNSLIQVIKFQTRKKNRGCLTIHSQLQDKPPAKLATKNVDTTKWQQSSSQPQMHLVSAKAKETLQKNLL